MAILDPKRARAEADRELEEGIALLRAAHQLKLQAIQVLEMMSGGSDERDEEPRGSRAQQQQELRRGELPAAFERLLPKLDEKFDKGQVFRALKAFDPDVAGRTTERAVSLLLSRLAKKRDRIKVAEEGEGRAPTTYQRVDDDGEKDVEGEAG